jgi:carbon-monoxide dehydrogenase large subunit
VRVIAPDVGGGFGGKVSVYPEEILVAAAARELGRPVKWTSDRLEDLVSTSQAFDETIDAELGVHADGSIAGLRADVIGDRRLLDLSMDSRPRTGAARAAC